MCDFCAHYEPPCEELQFAQHKSSIALPLHGYGKLLQQLEFTIDISINWIITIYYWIKNISCKRMKLDIEGYIILLSKSGHSNINLYGKITVLL